MKVPNQRKAPSIFLATMLVISGSMAAADSIQLRDGRHLQGRYIGGSTTTIGFMTAHSVEYFQTSDVLALIFDNNPEPPTNGLTPKNMGAPASPSVVSPIHGDLQRKSILPSRRRAEDINAVFRYVVE